MDGPGAPGAAVPSSPGGSGSRTLDSSSASASSASPLPSAARPSEAHLEAHHTLSPAGRRQAPDRVDTMKVFFKTHGNISCLIVLTQILFLSVELSWNKIH